jgi:hypothetical protein
MSESYIDGLLDELVPAEPREGWDDVVRRARRSQRRYVALVVAIAVLVLAPATWAAVKAFEGTPAPPKIQQSFVRMNSMLTEAQAGVAESSLLRQIQTADVSKAHGVLQVPTRYGPLDLWVAPEFGGKGRCWFISWVREMNTPQGFGGGACTNPATPGGGIDVGPQWDAGHPSISVLYGSVSGPESTLAVKLRDGRTVTLPVVEHLALGVVSGHDFGPFPIVSYTGHNASGKVVAFGKSVGSTLPRRFSAAGSRRVALEMRERWLREVARRAKSDPSQRFANLSKAEFRSRLDSAGRRYGFKVETLRFLRPRQVAPLVVVRTADRAALLKPFAVGNIFTAIDPAKMKEGVGVRPFEALFFEAMDGDGVPFLVAQNEERYSVDGGIADGGGEAWTREVPTPVLGLIG